MKRTILAALAVALAAPAAAQINGGGIYYSPPAFTGGAVASPMLLPTGTAAAKPLAFSGLAGTGLWLPNQTNFTASFVLGTGGGALAHAAGTEGFRNTFVGMYAGDSNTTGAGNTALGSYALQKNTTADANAAFGAFALQDNTTGHSNAAFGKGALADSTTGYANTAVGFNSLFTLTTGWDNTAIGKGAMGLTTTGYYNTCVGGGCMATNVDGYHNSCVGEWCLFGLTSGYWNSAVGRNALGLLTTGHHNVAIGEEAGTEPLGVIANAATTASYNSFLGTECGFTSATQHENSTCVGYRAGISASNQVVLGDANVTEVLASSDAGATVKAAVFAGGAGSQGAPAWSFADQATSGCWYATGLRCGVGNGEFLYMGGTQVRVATSADLTVTKSIQGGDNVTLTEGAATPVSQIAVPQTAGANFADATVGWEVYASDGTDTQTLKGATYLTAVNKAGTETCTVGDVGTPINAVSAGTLTCTPTCVTGLADAVQLALNCTSSLTQTTLKAVVRPNLLQPNVVTLF